MVLKQVDLEQCVVVELEGERAEGVDFDADQGALLIVPTAIVACDPVDRALGAQIKSRLGGAPRPGL
jgi:hypothetical protein